ncbi:SURF1 family protein [Luteimonas panaciterrae]|uniref:SURF1 family protein n=1 Tax=Luteimonas panaciterrae TaxID=363885 RepID=UPI001CF9DA4C|nr:SURF1 family protein [Luteimonas panaciterrae]
MSALDHEPAPANAKPRGKTALIALAVVFIVAFVGLIALGGWQVQRRAWKLDLIERVESRIHAPPSTAPGPDEWSRVSVARDEYKHVRLDGRFLADRDTRVQAVTDLGAGFWLLSPFRTADGSVVLVNRGFVPADWKAPVGSNPASATSITGLLRMTEPGGGFLRKNAPAEDRWYSRDVQAIAAARGLGRVAPYFVDADRQGPVDAAEPRWPVGGLTVVRFPNNHLVYALTWFGLALMVAAAAWRVALEERRRRVAAYSSG